MQDDPDDTQRCDQQVIAIPPALPVTRWRHGYYLHGYLGNDKKRVTSIETFIHRGGRIHIRKQKKKTLKNLKATLNRLTSSTNMKVKTTDMVARGNVA